MIKAWYYWRNKESHRLWVSELDVTGRKIAGVLSKADAYMAASNPDDEVIKAWLEGQAARNGRWLG